MKKIGNPIIFRTDMQKDRLEIYLLRHGETEWTLSGQHTGRTDLSLTEEGKRQALLLKKRIQEIPFSAVFSSPLKRSLETCHIACPNHQPIIETDAKEWDYGQYEGKVRADILQANPTWDLFIQGAPQGESPDQVAQRADRLIELFIRQKGPVALFSHGHFLRVLAARWIQLNVEKGKHFALSVASLSLLSFEHAHTRVIQIWNDTHHLFHTPFDK